MLWYNILCYIISQGFFCCCCFLHAMLKQQGRGLSSVTAWRALFDVVVRTHVPQNTVAVCFTLILSEGQRTQLFWSALPQSIIVKSRADSSLTNHRQDFSILCLGWFDLDLGRFFYFYVQLFFLYLGWSYLDRCFDLELM